MRFTGEPLLYSPKSLLNMPATGERLQAKIKYLPKRDQRPKWGQCPQVFPYLRAYYVFLRQPIN